MFAWQRGAEDILYGRPAIEVARGRHSHPHRRKVCRLLGYEPPHCEGEHGQEDNWHPYEPGRAGIFSAQKAIEQREAGQGKGCSDTSYERLLLYPSLGCEPWADRNTENKASSPAHPPGFAGIPGSPLN